MTKRENAQPSLLETPRTIEVPAGEQIIVHPTVRLGSLVLREDQVIARASQIAKQLAQIVNRQKLFTVINGKKHVWVEGWTTLGAILGVTPVEEWCRPVPDANGFEARVHLVRGDGSLGGAASAQCTTDETRWQGRDSYAVRSMAITRATGKAFRLSFAWIMKLAGYEPLPAEEAEMDRSEQKQAQQDTMETKLRESVERVEAQKAQGAVPTLFCQWPETHNGHYAFLTGSKKVTTEVAGRLGSDCKAKWNEEHQGFYVASGRIALVKEICELSGIQFHELKPNPLAKEQASAS
jgi:hypothetical protein